MAENRKVEDEVMTNAVGGTEGATVELFKVGERVVYISTAQVGRIREVYPNEKDLSNSRYTVVFQDEVMRNVKHTWLRRTNPV